MKKIVNIRPLFSTKGAHNKYSYHHRRGRNSLKDYLILTILLGVLLIVTGGELKYLQTHYLLGKIISNGINYDAFRELRLDQTDLQHSQNHIKHLLKRDPESHNKEYMDGIGYLTFSMMASSFNLIDYKVVDESTFRLGYDKVTATKSFQELYQYYKAILSDLEYFPVPTVNTAEVYYENSWNYLRTYGGNRRHEGTDLMASNNQRGFFPILSITEGVVEKMGWLEQGGYRIGIRSSSGGYFYYAHLDTYAPQLKEGDKIIAGQLLGFMGDSGYGKEGTIGAFDVHLHMGFYIDSKLGEMSVNPYWILKGLEKNRTHYSIK